MKRVVPTKLTRESVLSHNDVYNLSNFLMRERGSLVTRFIALTPS